MSDLTPACVEKWCCQRAVPAGPYTCVSQRGCAHFFMTPGSAFPPHRLDFNGFYTERLERLSAERSQKAAPQVPVLRGPPAQAPRVAVAAQ